MDVDVIRALCSVCGEREVFDIGQETPAMPWQFDLHACITGNAR